MRVTDLDTGERIDYTVPQGHAENVVPEPSVISILGLGLGLLAFRAGRAS